MATPRGLTQFAFASGIDESQQTEVLDPMAGFTRLENCRQDRRGGLSKRLGFTSLATARLDATSRTAGKKLYALGDSFGTIDGTKLDVWSSAASRFVEVGRVSEVSTRLIQAPSGVTETTGVSATVIDVAVCNGMVVLMHYTGSSVYVSVVGTDGTLVKGPTATLTGAADCFGALGWYGTTVCAFSSQGSSANIALHTLDVSSAAGITTGWVSRGNVATDKSTSGNSGVALAAQSLSDRVAFAYVNSSVGTDRMSVKTVTTLVQSSTAVYTGGLAPAGVALGGPSTLWAAWNTGTDVGVIGLSPSTLSITATATYLMTITTGDPTIAVCEGSTANTGRVFSNDSSTQIRMRDFTVSAGAVAGAASMNTVYAAQLNSRVTQYGGRYYGICTPFASNAQSMHLLCDLTENSARARPVANIEPGLSVGLPNARCHLEVVGTKLYGLVQVKRTATIYATFVTEYDFASSTRWQPVEHSGAVYLSGGILSRFDGTALAESGFLYGPSTPTWSTSGTGLTPATGYRWIAVYEVADGDGNWIVSGVSSPSSSTGAQANKGFSVVVGTYSLTYRPARSASATDERIALYRTTDGGTLYYRVAVKPNNTAASTVTFTDTTDDTTLATAAKLYRPQGGLAGEEQDHRSPPGFTALASYGGMLVGVTGQSIWNSGSDVVGVAPWFNPIFRQDVQDAGDFTAIWSQDGSLFLAKRRALYVTSGSAPSGNGASGGLGVPRKLAVDAGCVDQRSVVVTSLGTFFQSERGIELLSRAQSVEWIGEAVQATLASYPVIVSATLDQAAALVRFECVASEASNVVADTGVQLVYNLSLRTWVSTDKVTTTDNAIRSACSACVVSYGGVYRYARLDKNGTVYLERAASDGSAHLDGSTWVTMLAETAWLKLGGIQGKHMVNRFLWLARSSTRADLSLAFAYDYAGTYKTEATWAASAVDTLSTAIGRIQLEHPMHDEAEGVAIRALFSDATPTGGTVTTGKGATWIALTFEGTPRDGATALPQESR